MKVEVVTPEEYMGDVMGDLNRRRGIVQGMEDSASGKVIMRKCLWQRCLAIQLICALLLRDVPLIRWNSLNTLKCLLQSLN